MKHAKSIHHICLPTKSMILAWTHPLTIERLMSNYKWPKKIATQWFQDFMCWLYSAQRWRLTHQEEFNMDNMHYLDEVWHEYILCTNDYFKMSRELFGVDYIHHQPESPFSHVDIDPAQLTAQLEFLMEDWGEEYIDRVWEYGADLSDIQENLDN